MTTLAERRSLPPSGPPIHLTIRFSASIPDLALDVPSAETTTFVALKHLIRGRLEPPYNSHRLRFIYQGKIIQDGSTLSTILRPNASSSATTAAASQATTLNDHKGKGKAKAPDEDPETRIYINCSIGDVLSAAELESEARAAQKKPSSSTSSKSSTARRGTHTGGGPAPDNAQGSAGAAEQSAATTAPVPRGFDRLLGAGFSTAEISQLRLQFRDIHAQRHTPDTMPSPDTLRSMEDAWMDVNAADAVPGGATTTAPGTGGAGPEDGLGGGVNDQLDGLVKGMIMGFFWPVGGIVWLTREEGMMAQRWKVWIGFGLTFCTVVGIMRTLFGGDH